MDYPARLDLALLPTPLQKLSRLSAELGKEVWVKRDDLTGSVLSGNKVRKLEFCLARAIAEGADSVITCGGLQSNHCRATALACAQLGLRCHLVLRGEPEVPADGNLLLDRLAGASIETWHAKDYQSRLDELLQAAADRLRAEGHKPYVIPTGASDATGVWGYVAACEELAEDFGELGGAVDAIVCASGSGGTQAGLSAGVVLFDLETPVYGINVCDDESWFLSKVRQDLCDWRDHYDLSLHVEAVPVTVLDGHVGPGYGKAESPVYDTIAKLAALEGLVLDPVYTGKAFHGMLKELESGRLQHCQRIVFIHTGGVFGLFPHRQQCHNAATSGNQ